MKTFLIALAATLMPGLLNGDTALVPGPHLQVSLVRSDSKLSSPLRALRQQLSPLAALSALTTTDWKQLSNPLVRLDGEGRVQVYLKLDGIEPKHLVALAEMGFEVERIHPPSQTVQGWVSVNSLDALSGLPFVRKVRHPVYGRVRAGSVTTEGDAILRADELRDAGRTGSGVKVGVISDGANDRADAQATDDLPGTITVFGTCEGAGDGACNEGTAMLEIIHDIAPDAELAMGAAATSLDFIDRVNDLDGTFGADIIVDDLGYFEEPFFEDGPVADAVTTAINNNGVLYVSATGNEAEDHYQGEFSASTILGLGVPEHNFGTAAGGAADPTFDIQLAAGGSLTVFLQWTNAFGQASDDYDLLIVNEAETGILASGQEAQDGDDDPQESATYTNQTNGTITVKIVISKFSGEDRTLEMFAFGGTKVDDFVVVEKSVFGHPAVTGAVAVAAIDASDPGNDTINSFSSQGPAEIFFPQPETRPKPDVAGIDGVTVTGTGGFPSPFSGTSAAAPHVAAVAALLHNGDQTATDVVAALKGGAVDLGDAGTDSVFGAGRVDAVAALEELGGGGGGDDDDDDDDDNGSSGGCSLLPYAR